MMSDVLVIKSRHAVRPERLRELRRDILTQKETDNSRGTGLWQPGDTD